MSENTDDIPTIVYMICFLRKSTYKAFGRSLQKSCQKFHDFTEKLVFHSLFHCIQCHDGNKLPTKCWLLITGSFCLTWKQKL